MGVRKQAQISPPPFFAAVACRRQRLEAIHRKNFRGGGRSTASKGVGVRKQAQISPPPFFLRLSPVGGSGWKPSRRRRQNPPLPQAFSWSGSRTAAGATAKSPLPQVFSWPGSRTAAGATAKSPLPQAFSWPGSRTAAGATAKSPLPQAFGWPGLRTANGGRCSAGRARGQQQERRQNPPLPQVFSWPGSRTANGGRCSAGRAREQQTGAGVQLFGLQQGGNVKERKRKNPIFAAGEIMPWPSVAHIDPSHRPQIKGAGGGRRRRKKRRAAGRKTAL